jgi:hypothetical protein
MRLNLAEREREREGLFGPAGLTPSGPPFGCCVDKLVNLVSHELPPDSSVRIAEPYGRYPSPSPLDSKAIANRRVIRPDQLAEREGFEPSKGF